MNVTPHINYFGQTDFRGRRTPFGIKAEDRSRHMYIIGKTGMGKSTLIENLIIQDIKNGEGLAFIDPHGKSAETMLDYVPQERIDDVVYFAPFDLDWPVAFNVMEDVGKDNRHLVANGLMASFKKIWPDVWSARMEYILNNTILALLEYPNSTLLGVNRMLSDKVYRQKVVDNISDPSVKSFWVDEFAKYNERYMQEAGDAIKNKIGQFTSNPLIRNIVGQPKSSFDIRQIMDNKKILIINLSKGRVGEQNASLLGGMLITKIYLAAMSRANVAEAELKRLPQFYFFVDEFQSFVNDSFADILAEARKYKLALTIAHQYIEQVPETVRSAVFGNVGTTIAFRVGPFDAEVLERLFFPTFSKEDLVNLGFAQIYLTLMIDGVGSQPFSAVTLPPIANLEDSLKDKIIALSRGKYARHRDKVEADIIAWHGEDKNQAFDNRSKPKSQPRSKHQDQAKQKRPFMNQGLSQKPKSISLSELKRDPKQKEKSSVNSQSRADLRSALAEIMESKNDVSKPPIESKQTIVEKTPLQEKDRPDKPNSKTEPSPAKEVPEEVLKKILAVDDKE